MHRDDDDIRRDIYTLLQGAGQVSADPSGKKTPITIEPLHGDGSSRKFYRVTREGEPLCIAVYPPAVDQHGLAEYGAAAIIGSHLQKAGLPVPAIIGQRDDRGLLLFEDLGDRRLHDLMLADRARGVGYYPDIIKLLVRLQVEGGRGFQTHWCHDSPAYDRQVMLEKESGYFYQSFWRNSLGGEQIPGIKGEFQMLAETAETYFEPFFLHRDFQSRNLMVHRGHIRVIDFQGGRMGPPAYDLASLLIDPYATLSRAEQEHFFDLYLDEIASCPEIDAAKVEDSYPYLALQRNLQIIGAFAFLSDVKQKRFFQAYLRPALVSLNERLQDDRFGGYTILRKTAGEALERYDRLQEG
jgi:aminoglycoside/choline kinase family phosphotransferase